MKPEGRSLMHFPLWGEAKATAVTEMFQAPPIRGQEPCLGGSAALTHPNGRGHVIRTHLGKVPLQHPVVKTVEEEGDAEVHRIFWFDSTTEQPKRHQELFGGGGAAVGVQSHCVLTQPTALTPS